MVCVAAAAAQASSIDICGKGKILCPERTDCHSPRAATLRSSWELIVAPPQDFASEAEI
jgi:hypothetical protein